MFCQALPDFWHSVPATNGWLVAMATVARSPLFNKDFSCNQDLFASAGALDLSLFTQSGH